MLGFLFSKYNFYERFKESFINDGTHFSIFWHSLLLTLCFQNHRPPTQTGRYWRPKRLSWSQPSFSFSRLAVTCHLKWIDNNTKGSNQDFTLKMDLGTKVGQCCYCCCCCASVTIEYIIKGIFFLQYQIAKMENNLPICHIFFVSPETKPVLNLMLRQSRCWNKDFLFWFRQKIIRFVFNQANVLIVNVIDTKLSLFSLSLTISWGFIKWTSSLSSVSNQWDN